MIRDVQSHLSYHCIDNYLVQGPPDDQLGLQISLIHEVETGWVLTEGSGNAAIAGTPPGTLVADRAGGAVQDLAALHSAGASRAARPPRIQKLATSNADVIAEVNRRTRIALAFGYGDNPTPRQLSAGPVALGGVTGYEQVTTIAIDPAYRAANDLKVANERLYVLGVATSVGVSIFLMSIPDDRSDLWPEAQAIVAGVRVI